MHWSILAFSACSCCSSEQRALSRQKVSWVHGGFAPSHLGCLYASKCLGWGVGLSTILQGILCTTSPAALGLQSLATTPAALGGHPTPETVLVFPLCFEGTKDLIVWVWSVKGQTCRLLRNWVLLPAVCTQQGQIQTPTCSDLFLAGWMFLQSVSLQLLSQGPHRYSWIRVSYLLYLPVPQR